MKEIFISKENQYDPQESALAVNDLEEINLNKDIIISTPSIDKEDQSFFNDVDFNGYGFNIKNCYNLRLSKSYTFEFVPRVRLCIPNGLKLIITSLIPGLACIHSNYNTLQGIILKDYRLLPNLDNLIAYADDINFTFYNKCEFILKEYDRDLFLKYSLDAYKTSTRLNINSNVVSMEFLCTFIGNGFNPQYNDVYIIHSDYIYNNIPDLGGFK